MDALHLKWVFTGTKGLQMLQESAWLLEISSTTAVKC